MVVSRGFIVKSSLLTPERFFTVGFLAFGSQRSHLARLCSGVIHVLGVSIWSRLLPGTTLVLGAFVVACLTFPIGVETG